MNEEGNAMARNAELLKKLGAFLRYLLAFDLLFLAFLLGGYVHGKGDLSGLMGMLGQVFMVSSMVLSNTAQLPQNKAKIRKVAGLVLLACSLVIAFFLLRDIVFSTSAPVTRT